jgi:hypothetical protein
LICDARLMAEASKRYVANQIELWAQLGRALEPLLRGDRVVALRQAAAGRPLSAVVQEVTSELGQKRVQDYLLTRLYPRFETVIGSPGLLRKIEADGSVSVGKFVNRVFEPTEG